MWLRIVVGGGGRILEGYVSLSVWAVICLFPVPLFTCPHPTHVFLRERPAATAPAPSQVPRVQLPGNEAEAMYTPKRKGCTHHTHRKLCGGRTPTSTASSCVDPMRPPAVRSRSGNSRRRLLECHSPRPQWQWRSCCLVVGSAGLKS